MAGIGFRLQSLLRDNTYTGLAKAYLYSACISTGPWLVSVLSLFLIGLLAPWRQNDQDFSLFRVVVTYTYLASLVLTGGIQVATTRYVADRLFVADTGALQPCYIWSSAVTVLGGGLLAGLFHWFAGLTFSQSLAAVLLFQAISLTWMGMIFLSAAKDYTGIVAAFVLGYATSVVGAVYGAHEAGLTGALWGLALGHGFLAALLGARIYIEFPSTRPPEPLVLTTWRRMPSLIVLGVFFNLGLWADKLIFWAGPHSESVAGWFRVCMRYDICAFLGYLTVVPAMALFLIRVETGFYKHYAAFYEAATRAGDLEALRHEKRQMGEALRLSAQRLLKLQGGLSLFFILIAPAILSALGLPADFAPNLRLMILASLLQVLVLILFIFILYFDWQKEVAVLSLCFAGLNVLFTVASQPLDARWHGIGYLAACLVTLVVGLARIEARMKDLEFETFTREPILT